MDARLQFEWSGEKAKDLVADIFYKGYLGPANQDIINLDDSEYEISLSIKLNNKRKSRRKNKEANKV